MISITSITIFIAFVQCWTNSEDVGPALFKCYKNVLCLLGRHKTQFGLILIHRLWLLPSIESMLDEHIMPGGRMLSYQCVSSRDAGPSSTTPAQHQPNIGPTPRVCWAIIRLLNQIRLLFNDWSSPTKWYTLGQDCYNAVQTSTPLPQHWYVLEVCVVL